MIMTYKQHITIRHDRFEAALNRKLRRRQSRGLSTHILVQAGWRPVSNRRARTLRKRGEHVRWMPDLGSMGWVPRPLLVQLGGHC